MTEPSKPSPLQINQIYAYFGFNGLTQSGIKMRTTIHAIFSKIVATGSFDQQMTMSFGLGECVHWLQEEEQKALMITTLIKARLDPIVFYHSETGYDLSLSWAPGTFSKESACWPDRPAWPAELTPQWQIDGGKFRCIHRIEVNDELTQRRHNHRLPIAERGDCILKAFGCSFPVHREQVTRYSPFLYELLGPSNDDDASAPSEIDLDDLHCSAETLQRCLSCLYTGIIYCTDKEKLLELFELTQEWNIEALSEQCLWLMHKRVKLDVTSVAVVPLDYVNNVLACVKKFPRTTASRKLLELLAYALWNDRWFYCMRAEEIQDIFSIADRAQQLECPNLYLAALQQIFNAGCSGNRFASSVPNPKILSVIREWANQGTEHNDYPKQVLLDHLSQNVDWWAHNTINSL